MCHRVSQGCWALGARLFGRSRGSLVIHQESCLRRSQAKSVKQPNGRETGQRRNRLESFPSELDPERELVAIKELRELEVAGLLVEAGPERNAFASAALLIMDAKSDEGTDK